jgi:putative CocE/NonD family hydrolase
LKGIRNGITREPLVKLFVMGSNSWRTGHTYPLENTRFRKLYLSSGGNAYTDGGDGALGWKIPDGGVDYDSYVYDPADPTPHQDFYPTRSRQEKETEVVSEEKEKWERKRYHRRVGNQRKDILIYLSDPLKKPLTVCGPLSAVLYASTSAKDTDWFITFSVEDSRGEIFALVQGRIRARYRDSVFAPELLEGGKVYRYRLDLWQTGVEAPVGSRLRVEVASAVFPMFSRNLNTGGHSEMETEFVKAEQKIFHNAAYPSHILLPVLPAD